MQEHKRNMFSIERNKGKYLQSLHDYKIPINSWNHENTTIRKYQIMVKKYNANKFSIDKIKVEQLQNSNGWNSSTNHEALE
jgi:hypothetical protein